MSRVPVHVRDATPGDAESLLSLWSEFARRGHAERFAADAQLAEAAAAVARISVDPDQRLVVGVIEGKVVAAAHLVRTSLSPIHGDAAIQISHLQVEEAYRRNGVGKALIEATVSWAEEKDTTHILATANVHSRDANRFMARLGLAQVAIVRAATVASLRAKLPVEPPACAKVSGRSHRSVGQVLAQRRNQRRAQSRAEV
ncbi:MAG TPA: GNAT family N-acetyltransferase [Nocardioidaceae bacterium]|nr:GNAT family N-acetyltransferase [Nocardioidaceae bacterium]